MVIKMAKKKLLAVIIISIISVGIIIGLIPVFIYGFQVRAISFDLGMGVSGTPSSSSADYSSTTIITIDENVVNLNPYEYFFRKFDGVTKVENPSQIDLGVSIDLLIYINFTTPNSGFHEFSFTLDDILGIGNQDVNMLFGPDELEIISGTYDVWIYVEITIAITDPIVYNETFILGPFHILLDVVVE